MEIYCYNKSERDEFEASSKGYRSDVFVKINDEYYNVTIYDTVRLVQDFETENEDYGFFAIDPNIVLVRDVSTPIIKYVLKKLYDSHYFEKIKPVRKSELYIEKFRKM